MKKKNPLIYIAAVSALFLGAFVIKENLVKCYEKYEFKHVCDYMNTSLGEEIPGYFTEEDYILEVKPVISSAVLPYENGGDHVWEESFHADITLDPSFDTLTDSEKYDLMLSWRKIYINSINKEIEENCPKHDELAGIYLLGEKEYNGGELYYDFPEKTLRFHTEQNEYEIFSPNLEYYCKNGEEVFMGKLKEEKDGSPESLKQKANISSEEGNSFEEGYDDVYLNEDYDTERYAQDEDYANGVEEAMEDAAEDFGDDW